MGSDASIYTFAFYPLATGETPTTPTEPTEPAGGDTYVLSDTLKDGDKVIVVHQSTNKAMSEYDLSETYPKYRAGVDVDPTDGKITTDNSKIVWDVVKTPDGYQFKNDAGDTLSATDGLLFADTDNVWAITASTVSGCHVITSTTAKGNSGDPKSIEWYSYFNEFSTFYLNDTNAADFAMQFYVLSDEVACAHEWDDGEVTTEPWCTVAGEKTFTCTKCQATKTEIIPALGHIDEDNNDICDRCRANLAAGDYSIAESVAAGDKIIIVAEFEGKYYAVVNDNTTVNNALNAIEVNVTSEGLVIPYGADLLWEICEGEEGTFTLKSSDGKYINNTSGSTTKLSGTGTSYIITCGEGISKITLPGNVGRSLMLRVNDGVPQFRNYSDSNATKSDYSAVITIWKAN